jgi:hypothetical protein
MNGDCCTFVLYWPGPAGFSRSQFAPGLGGAKGTRTPDPLLAKRRIRVL